MKNTVTAALSQEETELVAQAQEKYKSDGKGSCSIRMLLIMGAKYYIETHDNKS